MAKSDTNIAGGSKSAEVLTEQPTPTRVTSEEEARILVSRKYQVPAGCRLVIVTEDCNVFWQQNTGSAVNHASKNNLKIFRLSWD
jgi:hypothetical protein